MIFTAQNAIGAGKGDLVKVESATGPVMKAAMVLYVIPLVLFFLGYALGARWGMGALAGCLAFAASIALVVVYDRKVQAKMNSVYTITGYVRREPEVF